jgi:hypothetical protein
MKESVADFVARGGAIRSIPAQEQPLVLHTLPVKASTIDFLDLGEGALIYSESALEKKTRRGVKPKTRKARVQAIDASLLPASLLGLLKTIEVSRNEEKEKNAAE